MDFGCAACFRGSAPEVWKAKPFVSVSRLVDDSHFTVDVMKCRTCGQPCVKVFTEFIDSQAGDDAQYWSVIPLTPIESGRLIAQGQKVNTKLIEAMSHGRRYLQADYPTGKNERVVWSVGPLWIMQGS